MSSLSKLVVKSFPVRKQPTWPHKGHNFVYFVSRKLSGLCVLCAPKIFLEKSTNATEKFFTNGG